VKEEVMTQKRRQRSEPEIATPASPETKAIPDEVENVVDSLTRRGRQAGDDGGLHPGAIEDALGEH
jgi:hypothetical protein